jgi:hypothetical protein
LHPVGEQGLLAHYRWHHTLLTSPSCWKESIEWHAADRILRDIYANPEKKARFTLLTGKQCTRFVLEGEGEGDKRIAGAEVRDLANSSDSYICARAYVVAAGAVANPQILFNSGFDAMMPNLGRYITERR